MQLLIPTITPVVKILFISSNVLKAGCLNLSKAPMHPFCKLLGIPNTLAACGSKKPQCWCSLRGSTPPPMQFIPLPRILTKRPNLFQRVNTSNGIRMRKWYVQWMRPEMFHGYCTPIDIGYVTMIDKGWFVALLFFLFSFSFWIGKLLDDDCVGWYYSSQLF
jgi:hypothetical protein